MMKEIGKAMKRFFAIFFVPVFMSVAAFAQDVTVEAEINKKQIVLGESARFTVTVEGSQSVEPPQAPAIDGLDFRYLGPSTQVSIINGQYSSSVAHAYSIFPMKAGTYRIPSLTVNADGKTFQTTPISLNVAVSAVAASPGLPQAAADLNSKMRVELKASKAEAYLQEPVPVKILLLVAADVQVGDVYVPKFIADGFEKGEFQHKRYYQVIDGIKFRVDELETLVYPQREGEQPGTADAETQPL